MALALVTAHRWATLLDHLGARLRESSDDPFAWSRVVVSSAATGRIVGQEMAARLGISAGVEYVTPGQLMGRFAERAGVARDRSRWLGTPLDLAVWQAVDELSQEHPILARTADPTRAGGRRATATRLARLLRWYVDVAPELVSAWLEGSDEGPDGRELPERWAWQPELLRNAALSLEIDPIDTLASIVEAAATDRVPTTVFAVDDLTAPQRATLEAFGALTVLAVEGSPGEAWGTALAGPPVRLGDHVRAVPSVELHDSHGPGRQIEVLRDELTRAFADDPTLEPRDVAIICPHPQRYAALLDGAFKQAVDGGHPGRSLRVQPVAGQAGNPVVSLMATVLRLGELRASASQLVELLLSAPLAHRWRLSDRQAVIELVGGAGIRWGMDAGHRAEFDLEGLAQNTWLRGLDRLLIGLTLADGHDGGLSLAGSDVVGSSDLETVGALCEIVSRLRRLIAATQQSATIPAWVRRARAVISDLIGLPRDDEWQVLHAHKVLARLEADHAGSATLLTRGEFAHLLEAAGGAPRARVAAGNGSLLVAPLGELGHVGFRLIALLGVTDDVVPGPSGIAPDAIDLGSLAPDRRSRWLAQLLDHARSAERVLIVRQAYSQRTNDAVATPSAVTWLLEQLGVAPAPLRHPPTATSEGNFRGRASFDATAHAGAVAHRGAAATGSLPARRRRQARTRPVGPLPTQVGLDHLARFLADPARAFLRSAAGLPLYEEPTLSDDLPIELDGLGRWKVLNDLIEARKAGTALDVVVQRLRSSEELPPEEIGRVAFLRELERADQLWAKAGPAFLQDITDVPLDLTFDLSGMGRIRLVDRVRLRGGAAVTVTPSKGDEKLITPWLESLALTATGVPTPGKLFRFRWDPVEKGDLPEERIVGLPDRDEALARLTTVVTAFALGQHRLIAVPVDAGIHFAEDAARGRYREADWRGRSTWRHRRWSSYGPSWSLFFGGEVAELFDDPRLDEDPDNGQPTAFGAWAVALYTGVTGRIG